MYSKDYWIKKGYTEEDAEQRTKGFVRCNVCSEYFLLSNSMSTGKYICSKNCKDIDYRNRIKKMTETKQVKKPCLVCSKEIKKSDSVYSSKYICSLECKLLYKDTVYSNIININNYKFWIKKGYSEVEAKNIVSSRQKKYSTISTDYWINKGMSLQDAKTKVSEIQSKRSRNRKVYTDLEKLHSFQHIEKLKIKNIERIYNFNKKYGEPLLNLFNDKYKYGYKNYKKLIKNIDQFSDFEYTCLVDLIEKTSLVSYFELYCGSGRSSKISRMFFALFAKNLQSQKLYFEPYTKEFSVFSKEDTRIYFYDFIDYENKICIEFNGSFWHGDPYTQEHNDETIELWSNDVRKMRNITQLGYSVYYVWYMRNKKFRYNGIIYNNMNDVIQVLYQEIYGVKK